MILLKEKKMLNLSATYFWFEFTDFDGKVNRGSCSGNRFPSGWNTPSHAVQISCIAIMILFTEKVNAKQPTFIVFPCLE